MLGAANGMLGLFEEAEKYLRHVVFHAPSHFQAHCNLGAALREQKKPEEALKHFERALQLNPGYAKAYFNRGCAQQDMGRYEKAIADFKIALQLVPDDAHAHYNLAESYRVSDNLDLALKHYTQAIQLNQDFDDAICGQATALKQLKYYQEAFDLYEDYFCKKHNTPSIKIVLSFADLCRHAGRPDKAIQMLERTLSADRGFLSADDRVGTYFALGHLYDTNCDYRLAFENFKKGNQLKTEIADFHGNEELTNTFVETTTSVLTDVFFRQVPRSSNTVDTPIFIVGMPRSGTSLVEQILCSHPKVFGGGELVFIHDIADGMQELIGSSSIFPYCLADLEQLHCDKASQVYLDKLAEIADSQADRVTDKMPWNFVHLGLLELLFPGARVIHCKRHSIDNCLSIYFQNFSSGHKFSFDLAETGKIYNLYLQLMAHWQSILKIPILEVKYEELVNNQEDVSRRMVEFCGLPWDKQCLEFQNNKRLVMTASTDQVTKPMYKSSIQRWKYYQPFISPLTEELNSQV